MRVPLDFSWPVNKVWEGYVNPHYNATKCTHCDGTGYSPMAKKLTDQWYGYAPFRPEDRGSVPFTINDAPIRAFAERNVSHAPEFYGRDSGAVDREARRLIELFNGQWSHHLNDDDVAALIAGERLYDFTHTWTPGTGWTPKQPPHVPTAREVNEWSLSGMGHDSINQWKVVKAECVRQGVSETCDYCHGESVIWLYEEDRLRYEAWESREPPEGDGYQIWETVSEGSPISPVFARPEQLASHMAGSRWGADDGSSYQTWLEFICGPGWAPSMAMSNGVMISGVAFTTRGR